MDRSAELQAFSMVARAGGFSAAARQLGMATSSITRLVDSLERRLGSTLLNRSTRNVTLTDAGSAYLEQAISILDQLETADDAAASDKNAPHGILRVTAPVTFSTLYIAPLIAEFHRRHPTLRLHLQLNDALSNMVDDAIDVAIRIGKLDDQANLIARRLIRHERIVCASPSYLLQHGVPEIPADLLKHNCLQFAYEKASRIGWHFKKDKNAEELFVSGTLMVNNSAVLHRTVLDGVGIAMLPDWLVRRDLDTGTLVRILGDYSANPGPMDVALYALYPATRRNSVKVKAFIDLLSEHLASTEGGTTT